MINIKKYFYIIARPLLRLYWFIVRPTTFGVKCLLYRNGKILCIRNTYGIGHWTLPGGGRKRNETSQVAVEREVHEEVGITLKSVLLIGTYSNNKEYKKDTVDVFFAQPESEKFIIDKGEVAEAAWFDLVAIPTFHSHAIDKAVVFAHQKGLLV